MTKFITAINTHQAILNFTSKHGYKYDYSKFEYTKAKDKSIIICKIHGEFMMTYDHHFRRGQNCPNCAPNRKQNTSDCIEAFKLVHGERYDYSSVVYIGNRNKVKIRCYEHGFFDQDPLSHKSGKNCPECSRIKSIVSWDETVKSFRNTHGDYYKYDESSYKKSEEKLRIICPVHGEFYQRASQHKLGRGCKECTMYYGWGKTPYLSRSHKYDGKSNLYICEMTSGDEVFIKVGISYEGFNSRFRKRELVKYNMSLLVEYSGDAELVWDLETQILRSMREYKYKPLVSFSGETECLYKIDNSVFDCLDMLSEMALLTKSF